MILRTLLTTSLLVLLTAAPALAQITRYASDTSGHIINFAQMIDPRGCTRAADTTFAVPPLPVCAPIRVDETTLWNTATGLGAIIPGWSPGTVRLFVNATDDRITCISLSSFVVTPSGVAHAAPSRNWLMQEPNAVQAPGVHVEVDVPLNWGVILDGHGSKCSASVRIMDILAGFFD